MPVTHEGPVASQLQAQGPALSAESVPNQLAHFEVIRKLGAGGMAEVFVAKKRGAEGTYKLLVVKRILPSYTQSQKFRSMFREEADLASRLNHPNVVHVYEFFEDPSDGYLLSMEYVEGLDLGALLGRARRLGRRVPPWLAAWVVAEAAKGLHYAHEKKDETGVPLEIVHRDVSPQNILLSFDGAVKIADFGIASARLFDQEFGVLKGKFGYMSPEQARGESIDRRSDLYALGVILWECLTGRPLHGGLGGEALLDIVRSGTVESPSTYVPDLPEALEAIVMKLLEPNRAQRFSSARELGGAIARALLVRQELVDATTLEATLSEFVRDEGAPRNVEAPGGAEALRDADLRTQAAVPLALSGAEGTTSGRPHRLSVAPSDSEDELPPVLEIPEYAGPREVRHVALLALRLGVQTSDAGELATQRTLFQLRKMLGEMAYKRGMTWVWSGPAEARAIAGLGSNAAKATVDAAWLALETHEAILGVLEDLPVATAASVGIVRGIASGQRDSEGNLVRFSLHDPAEHLARTLLDVVPTRDTWVTGGVYRLVRREFRWGDAPTLEVVPMPEVENLPPTMRIYALERSLTREERERLPSAGSDLVGRDAERAELHSAYHEAVSAGGGAGALVVRAVVGELGIGKSALVSTFLSELPPEARLVRVESSPVRMEVPLSTIADLIREVVGTTGDEPFDEVANAIARVGGGSASGNASNPMVARLAELATNRTLDSGRADDDEGGYRRKQIVSGVRNLLGAVGLSQPLVVVLEGLQWTDRPSLELLAEWTSTPDPLPILVLLVTRLSDRVQPLLEGKIRLELLGLSTAQQVRLVESRLGVREGVSEVCAELLPRVGGNPFFLLEVIDALLERGVLEIRETGEGHAVLVRRDSGKTGFVGLLPDTLEQLLADRLHELPPAERIACDWLAVAGGPLAEADLLKISRANDEAAVTAETLGRLCARGVVDAKGDMLDFRHPLTRDAAYHALGEDERRRKHRALGEYLMQTSLARGLPAAIVGRHLVRGGATPLAGECYFEAATAARLGYQTQLAIKYYKSALAYLAPEDSRVFAAHEALEAMFRMLGRRRDRARHLEAMRSSARRMGLARAACTALLRRGRFELDEMRLSKGLPVARRAAELAHAAGLSGLEIEAEELLSELLRELGDVQGALAASDRALAACDPRVHPHVPPRARAEILRSRGVLLRRVGRVQEAVDVYAEAIAVFRKVGARRQEARAANALGYAMFVQGHYEDAIALLLESIQIDLAIGGRFQLAKTLCNIGQAYCRIGDMARARVYLARARETHERYDDQDGRAETLNVSAELCLELDEVDAADPLAQEARALATASKNAYDSTHSAIVSAILARARRDASKAIAHAIEAKRAAEDHVLVAFQFYAMALEAAARIDAGEVHAATLLATTALGTVETLQGCEYGLEVRLLCADALKRAGSPQAPTARQKAIDYAAALAAQIRDPRLRRWFARRPIVADLFDATPIPGLSDDGLEEAQGADDTSELRWELPPDVEGDFFLDEGASGVQTGESPSSEGEP